MVAFEVLDSELSFAVNGFVKIFHNGGASRLHSVEVCINVVDEQLRSKT